MIFVVDLDKESLKIEAGNRRRTYNAVTKEKRQKEI
jgi:hypothetical protein